MNLTKFLLTAYLAVFSVGSQALTVPYDGRIDLSIQTAAVDPDAGDVLTYRYEVLDTDGTTVLSTVNGAIGSIDASILEQIVALPNYDVSNVYSIRAIVSDGIVETSSTVKSFQVEEPSAFLLAANGVTVKCDRAAIGDTGMVNGVLYTAVDNAMIRSKVASNDVAFYETACTSHVTDMNVDDTIAGAFYNASINPDVSHWDTSNVADMKYMFYLASSFNQDISNWDTSSVVDMKDMFYKATAFNWDISNWDTSSVVDMKDMFYKATAFNWDISNWDTGSVVDMKEIFRYATTFNQDISSWDTSSVTDMAGAFWNAQSFNQNISSWCVTNIPTMPASFDNTSGFYGNSAIQPQWGTCP